MLRVLLFLIAFGDLVLLFSSSVCAVQASTPSVLEFTLEYVDNSIEATIKNNLGASYYNFRFMGKNENEWNYYPIDSTSFSGYNTYNAYINSVPYEATNSDYTIVTLPSGNFHNLPLDSEVEVQIQALIGDYKEVVYGFSAPLPTYDYYFEGTISNWSETQTVIFTGSIPENEGSGLFVPEFTVSFVDNSYDVPTTYSIDPFTGANITHLGHRVENKSIEVVIKNQAFTSAEIDGNPTQLFYVVRWKGHFEDWTGYDKPGLSVVGFNADYDYYLENYGVEASNSDYTVKTYTLQSFGYVPDDGVIDFQVKAQVGYTYGYYGDHAPLLPIGINLKIVEESEWSNIQTFSFEEKAVIPEFPSWIVLPLFVSIATVVVVCRTRLNKAKKTGVCP